MSELPKIPESWVPFGNRFTRWLGAFILRRIGWRVTGNIPNEPKVLFAVAPHTSNWDFMFGVLVMFALGFKVSWLAKHSMFVWPIKRLMLAWGGVPVNRKAPGGMAEQVAEQFRSHDTMVIAIAPEGTRSKVGHLKTGFLRIAEAAQVPVFRTTIDYKTKQVIFGDLFYPTGNIEADERACYQYFQQYTGKNPELY